MTIRDGETGLPLIGAKDTRPMVVSIQTNGDPASTVIKDAVTGRPINGVVGIEFQMTPEGGHLALEFAPLTFSIKMINECVSDVRRPPKEIMGDADVDVSSLEHGEIVLARDRNNKPIAALQVLLLDQVEAERQALANGGICSRMQELVMAIQEYGFECMAGSLASAQPFIELCHHIDMLSESERRAMAAEQAMKMPAKRGEEEKGKTDKPALGLGRNREPNIAGPKSREIGIAKKDGAES